MTEGGLYGIEAIAAFRKGRDVSDIARDLTRVDIVALDPDVAVATAEYRRTGSGRRGAQSQVWVRRPEGWRIASAHVSLGRLDDWTDAHATTSATTCRQSPTAVTSSAPTTPAGSQRNPFGRVPSASSTVPIESGAGTPAMKSPNAAFGSAQTSTAIAPPPGAAHHPRPPRRPARPAHRAGRPAPSAPPAGTARRAGSARRSAAAPTCARRRPRPRSRRARRRRPPAPPAAPATRSRRGSRFPSRSISRPRLAISPSRPAARQQRHAPRPPVVPRRRRHRQPAEPEQVDEVGVGPEPRVRPDRIRRDLVERHEGRESSARRAGRPAPAPAPARASAPRAGRSRGTRRPRSAPPPARRSAGSPDAPRRGRAPAAARPPCAAPPPRRRRRASPPPRGRARSRSPRSGRRAPPAPRPSPRTTPPARRRRRTAGSRATARRPSAAGGAAPSGPTGTGPGIGVARVEPGGGPERRPGVVDGQREDRDRVERPAGRHDAPGGKRPERRLQPDDVVEPRRHPSRPRGVGAEAEGRPRRAPPPPPSPTTTRPAPRAGSSAFRGTGYGVRTPDEPGRELVEVGLADRDRPGGPQPRHRRRRPPPARRRRPGRPPSSAARRRRCCP